MPITRNNFKEFFERKKGSKIKMGIITVLFIFWLLITFALLTSEYRDSAIAFLVIITIVIFGAIVVIWKG